MQVSEALSCLGSIRTIWIDDLFNNGPEELADLLVQNWEVALSCNFDELNEIVAKAEYSFDVARRELIEKLRELGNVRMTEIKESFFERESAEFPADELHLDTVKKVCAALNVRIEDRWTFDGASEALSDLCAKGDENISYIVDLNESGGSETRGLDILKLLWTAKSKGTTFILTHEAVPTGESAKEGELRDILARDCDDALGIPLCVISKERLASAVEVDDLHEALKISIKRAGLRKSLAEVVARAADTVSASYRSAAVGLLSVPPEQLEAHVFERGFKEGVSELHVVERVFTSHMAQELRRFFGTDKEVLKSAKTLRRLRGIELKSTVTSPDPNLAAFRLAEVWESDELINMSFSPIACGDVFETDTYEVARKYPRKFILLAQPCDIALRPGGGRSQDTAFLVPLVKAPKGLEGERDIKKPLLPCMLLDEYWACDFRNTTAVRMAILDLASFREDGRIRVDEGHCPSEDLLAAQSRIYDKRTAAATKAIEAGVEIASAKASVSQVLQLTFDTREAFSRVHSPVFSALVGANAAAEIPKLPKRISWQLRRSGRVRMPYSVALLNQYLGVMSRQAFDMDYMTPGYSDGQPPKKD
jgi:hypothetical protein